MRPTLPLEIVLAQLVMVIHQRRETKIGTLIDYVYSDTCPR